MASTGNRAGTRRRKPRSNGSYLDASWITPSEDAVSSEPSTDSSPQPSLLSSSNLTQHQHDLGQHEAPKSENDLSASPAVQPLDIPAGLQPDPGGIRSSVPSRSSGSPRPSTADNNAADKSQETSSPPRESGATPAKAKKKRYANQHHAHWLEEAVEPIQPQKSATGEADYEPVPAPPPPPPPHRTLQQATHVRQPAVTTAGAQTPQSNSPSIFRLPHSPHGGSHGYDAPPIVPLVRPNYSPHGGV
ncbi:hypothetical protein ACHAQA_004128 [Verticillium albo-atrum]